MKRRTRLGAAAFAGAALLTLGLTSCAGASGPTDDELRDWAVTAYVPLNNFAEDLDAASDPTLNEVELQSQCVVLKQDVKDLKEIKPYPGKPDEWNKALDEYDKGFDACIAGDKLGTAEHLVEGNKHFKVVLDDMQSREVFQDNQMTSLT